jgi:prolyl oligopeptidase
MRSHPRIPPPAQVWWRLGAVLLLPSVALLLQTCGHRRQADSERPPAARTDNLKDVIHGVEVVDPYRWLEDGKSQETRAWIEAQNKHTEAVLSSLRGRDRLRRRITELEKIEVVDAPLVRRGRYFFSRQLAGQEQPALCLREGPKGNDQVLIDPLSMSPDHSTSVELWGVSRDGAVMAYGVRAGGEDDVAIHLFDVDARKDLPDLLPRALYFSFSFEPDRRGLYYARYGEEGIRVYHHAMGTDAAQDAQVFGAGYGPDKIITADVSEDGRHLLIQVRDGVADRRTEIYCRDLARGGSIRPIVHDIDARFVGSVGGRHLFLHTNWRAPKGRILAVDLENPAPDRWREVVAETDAVIESVATLGGKLVVHYTRDAASQVKVFAPDGKPVRDVVLPAIGSATVTGSWESPEAFVAFTSYPFPLTIYRYDLETGHQEEWARAKVPLGSSRLEVKQVWYESKDTTRIPMSLVYAKGILLDGSRPMFLTGYGGFGGSYTPGFSTVAVLWAERGGIYAVANLRGGGEFGEAWHEAGMLGNKQNVFDDFVAAAEWLIRSRYTNPSKLAIGGTSNGGLLVGAALTQRPDLFGAVACGYPFLDMLRYQKFQGAQWAISEYGVSDDPEQFKYLHAYSPYHHVKAGTKYPPVLFLTGDSDSRIDPLHARKMAALLQATTGSNRPILLRYDSGAGHAGFGLPQSRRIEEMTDELAFLFWQLGVAGIEPSSPKADQ